MVIGIFGESCVGKSTFADSLKEKLNVEIYTGKDFLRFEKNENAAKLTFCKKLQDAVTEGNIIYVISEKEHLSLLPEGAIRVLMTANIGSIKERFAKRMHGNLPLPIAAMLEKKHGCFDDEEHCIHIGPGKMDTNEAYSRILDMINV